MLNSYGEEEHRQEHPEAYAERGALTARPTDNLAHLFWMQEKLQAAIAANNLQPLGVINLCATDLRRCEELTVKCLLAIVAEVGEILNEKDMGINWKPWRQTLVPVNVEAVQDELVDLWHFLINASMLWGLDPPTLVRRFEVKHAENLARQQRGY